MIFIIDAGLLVNLSEDSYKELMVCMKGKDFTGVRKWVAKNSDSDATQLFRNLYDNSTEFLVNASIPQMVVILADYQYKAAFVADQELNIMAALTELMTSCEFK